MNHYLNQNAARIFASIVDPLLENNQESAKIDHSQGSFMPLFVDIIGKINIDKGGYKIAFAHYFSQNGDLVPDPDMTFFYFPGDRQVFPASYQNQLRYSEAIYFEGEWKYNKPLLLDLKQFAEIWLNNISEQQNLKAWRQEISKPINQ